MNNTVYFYIDESQNSNQKEAGSNLYLCMSLIYSEEKKEIHDELKQKKGDIFGDQFSGVTSKSLNKLLHYNDDNDDVKTQIVDTLRNLFFKSYISKLEFKEKKYDEVYYILLKSLLKDRIIKHKDRQIVIRYEQNTKISKKGIEQTVESVVDKIKKESKHVISSNPIIEEVTKDDLFVTIPDYSLGLFLTYNEEKKKKEPLQFKINRFEKLRSKIRLFIDLNGPVYYSRKSRKHI